MLHELRQHISDQVKENEILAPHTSYQIGGPADYFFVAETSNDVIRAIATAKELSIPYFILGGGSNLLISDKGFRGLIIKIANRGMEISSDRVTVEAGTPTAFVALKTVEAGLSGFEWAIGLPGTIGGAVRGNAGMYGGDMSAVVESVRCIKDGTVEDLSQVQCGFDYRNSLFKEQSGYVILSVTLRLSLDGDVAAGREKMKEILTRKKTQQPLEYPTAGCIFKNWQPNNQQELVELRQYLDLNSDEQIPLTANGCIPAGWLIDRAQLKGAGIGGIQVSKKHANFLVNTNHGCADDVIGLIALIKTRVRNLTHGIVNLQEEIEYLGF